MNSQPELDNQQANAPSNQQNSNAVSRANELLIGSKYSAELADRSKGHPRNAEMPDDVEASYTLCEVIGAGSYSIVKKGIHKSTQ